MTAAYATPAALRAALKARLENASAADPRFSLQQLMVHVAYDRLLARLFLSDDAHLWVLKGAAALIARLDVARHSKDIDLYWAKEGRRLDDAVVQLLRAADRDIGDHFRPAGVSKREFYDAPAGQQTPPTVQF